MPLSIRLVAMRFVAQVAPPRRSRPVTCRHYVSPIQHPPPHLQVSYQQLIITDGQLHLRHTIPRPFPANCLHGLPNRLSHTLPPSIV